MTRLKLSLLVLATTFSLTLGILAHQLFTNHGVLIPLFWQKSPFGWSLLPLWWIDLYTRHTYCMVVIHQANYLVATCLYLVLLSVVWVAVEIVHYRWKK